MKSTGLAYLLWFFFGLLGVHKFYLDKPVWGIVYLLTGGLFTIGWFIDIFTIPGDVRRANQNMYYMSRQMEEMDYV